MHNGSASTIFYPFKNNDLSRMQFELSYLLDGRNYTLKGSGATVADSSVRLWVENIDDEPGKRVRVWLEAVLPVELRSCTFSFQHEYSSIDRILCNGFQSWSETREYTPADIQHGLRGIARPIMEPYGDYSFYKYPEKPGILRSWLYTFTRQKQKVRFYGSLADPEAYTCFQHHVPQNELAIIRDVEGWRIDKSVLLAEWWEAETDEATALSHWYTLLDTPILRAEPATGWTSWYHYYTKVSEEIILQNLQAFQKEKIPLEYFQIDDGYQQFVGDWLTVNSKFPSGMKFVAGKIKEAGYKPGLWLAPLAVERKSQLYNEHRDWLVKNNKGKPERIGINPLWSGAFYALDIYNEEVRDYLRKVFETVLNDWGFEMVKLDFLYGAALIPRAGQTRGRIMQDTMDFLRQCVGEKLLLGCGVPLAAALSTTDYCRIGQDVHLGWEFGILKWCRNGERVSTYMALTNTINRRHLSGKFFWNDPDVFMLRKKKQKLSRDEQYTLLLVNLLFGDLLFTSDNIGEYEAETLQLYKSIFPLQQKVDIRVEQSHDLYKVHFRINDQYYTALINLSNRAQSYKLNKGLYFDNRSQEIMSGGEVLILQPHHSVCLMHIAYTPFALAGTKGHFFAGSEVRSLRLEQDNIVVELAENLLVHPELFIKTPADAGIETINGIAAKRIIKRGFDVWWV